MPQAGEALQAAGFKSADIQRSKQADGGRHRCKRRRLFGNES